jgi:hypothetical protein
MLTIIWMSIEAVVALVAAWTAGSPALLGFGGDNAIDPAIFRMGRNDENLGSTDFIPETFSVRRSFSTPSQPTAS